MRRVPLPTDTSRLRDDPSICTRREAAVSDREGVRGGVLAQQLPGK